jgi:hypothetical protein
MIIFKRNKNIQLKEVVVSCLSLAASTSFMKDRWRSIQDKTKMGMTTYSYMYHQKRRARLLSIPTARKWHNYINELLIMKALILRTTIRY